MIHLDHTLCWKAEQQATGANIHRVTSALAKYKHSVSLANKLQDSKPERAAYWAQRSKEHARELRLVLRDLA
jgi:hypothetical protein